MEPGQRAAPGHRQARPRRPRLHADHVRRVRLAAAVPADGHPRHPAGAGAAQPGQRVGVRPAHRRRQERLRADRRRRATTQLDSAPCERRTTRSTAEADAALAEEGFARGRARFARTADLRYFGQAFEVRVPVPDGADRRGGRSTRWPTAFHAEHRALYGYDFPATRRQQVEWVNLRVTGIGPIRGPRSGSRQVRQRGLEQRGAGACRPVDAAGLLRRRRRVRRHAGAVARRPGAGAPSSRARRSSRSSARRCRCTPASRPRIDDYRNVIVERSAR